MVDNTKAEITREQAQAMEENCKEMISKADALDRLMQHADFKLVFLEDYLKKEPSRIALLLAEQSWNMESTEKRELYRNDLNERLVGIARFHEFIRKTYAMANQAENQLNAINEAKIVQE
jgi:hypothetical protein